MNTTVNYIPDNWKPENKKSFNKWIKKINNHVEKTKL